MRRPLFAALLGLLAAQTPAPAQRFGEDRPAPGATAPAPVVAPAPAPVVAAPPAVLPSFPTTPAAATTRTVGRPAVVAEPPHEWAVRPEHGEWMICVKSYVGVNARAQAVELADHIRRQHKAAAYLFERNGEDRQREEVRQANFRQAKEAELAPFLRVQDRMKAEAATKGVEYIDTPTVYRMPKVAVESQWAVLVGGFTTADLARKGLNTVREWPVPTNEKLMDGAISSRADQGKTVTEATYVNPYRSALVFPNPAIRRVASQVNAVDPAIFKLNADEPLSLLRCPKAWTLIVKDFSVPTTVQTKDQDGGIMARLFGDANDPVKMLDATANQARELAKALRSDSMERAAKIGATRAGLIPRPLDSYVLHHRTGSRVTVGQFDAPDDPALLEMQRLLANMYFEVWDKPQSQGGRKLDDRRMFDGITVMPIPKQ